MLKENLAQIEQYNLLVKKYNRAVAKSRSKKVSLPQGIKEVIEGTFMEDYDFRKMVAPNEILNDVDSMESEIIVVIDIAAEVQRVGENANGIPKAEQRGLKLIIKYMKIYELLSTWYIDQFKHVFKELKDQDVLDQLEALIPNEPDLAIFRNTVQY